MKAIMVSCLLMAIGAFAQPKGFIDVTPESGVPKILDDKYAADPKWWLSGLNLVDLDGDGHLDLFLGAHGGGKALVLLNDGKGHFSPAPGDYPDREAYLPADINEDGLLDLMVTHEDGAGRWWINQSVKGELHFVKSKTGPGRARANAIADINRDGKIDWLHEDNQGIAFEFGDGKGNFAPGGSLAVVKSKNETNMIPVDLNGDGHLDLIVHWGRYEFVEGKSRIFLADGKGGFIDSTAVCGLQEEGIAIKGIGDLNQDGATDLIALDHRKLVLFINDGHGKFTRRDDLVTGMESARKPAYASWGMAAVTDFDNDGIPDILWNGRNFLWVLHGLGGGKFEYANKAWGIEDTASATVDDGLCFGDIDNDGALDIIGYTGKLDGQRRFKIYRNGVAGENRYLNINLIGAAGNRGAAGAKIRVSAGGKLLWYEQVANVGSQSAHSYYSKGTTQRHIGLGRLDAADVEVEFYPSGTKVEVKAGKGEVEVKE